MSNHIEALLQNNSNTIAELGSMNMVNEFVSFIQNFSSQLNGVAKDGMTLTFAGNKGVVASAKSVFGA